MSWGKGNWGELDKAGDEEAEQARYHMRRTRRKSAYRSICCLTIAAAAIIAGTLP